MKVVDVAVGIVKKDQAYLIAKRPAHTELGGLWEFPGGKLEPDEDPKQALIRELAEEVGVEIIEASFWFEINYQLSDIKTVCLHIFHVAQFKGTAYGREGQIIRWVSAEQLTHYQFPPANAVLIEQLSKHLIDNTQ